jgi:hypothetical protein
VDDGDEGGRFLVDGGISVPSCMMMLLDNYRTLSSWINMLGEILPHKI